MTLERALRGFAGFFILVSLILAYFVNQKWLWFTAFIGFNLFSRPSLALGRDPAIFFTLWCGTVVIYKLVSDDVGVKEMWDEINSF